MASLSSVRQFFADVVLPSSNGGTAHCSREFGYWWEDGMAGRSQDEVAPELGRFAVTGAGRAGLEELSQCSPLPVDDPLKQGGVHRVRLPHRPHFFAGGAPAFWPLGARSSCGTRGLE